MVDKRTVLILILFLSLSTVTAISWNSETTGIGINVFDQDLNTTDSPSFQNLTIEGNITTTNLTATDTIVARFFKGLFSWIINTEDSSPVYLNFNGSTLSFNETKLNETISDLAGGGSSLTSAIANETYVNVDGDNMTGALNMSANDIHNVGTISVRQFIEGIFGGRIDLAGDPWFLSGTDFEIDRDLKVNNTEIENELIVGGNVTSSNWFKGLFNWIINTEDSSSVYFTFNGTTLNFSETKLNFTIEDIRSKNFQASFDLNFSDESIGDFFKTDFQNSFNINISDWETRVNASYLSTFNNTYNNLNSSLWLQTETGTYLRNDTSFVGIGAPVAGSPLHVFHATENIILTLESGDDNVVLELSDENGTMWIGFSGSNDAGANGDLSLGGVAPLIINDFGNVTIGSGGWFRGLFNWTAIFTDNFIFGGFTGSVLTIELNKTLLNDTIEDIRSKNFQDSFDLNITILELLPSTQLNSTYVKLTNYQTAFNNNISDIKIGNFSDIDFQEAFNNNITILELISSTIANVTYIKLTDFQVAFLANLSDIAIGNFSIEEFQNSFNINITDWETRVNASYLATFNITYDKFAYNQTQSADGDIYLINTTDGFVIDYAFNETKLNETIQDQSLNNTEANLIYLNLSGTNANQNLVLNPFTMQVPTPVFENDTANKEYVDDAVAGINFDFFLNDGESDITGYFNMTEEDLDEPQTSLTSPALPIGTTTIFNFTTLEGQPEFHTLIGGIYDAHIHLEKSSPGTRDVRIFWELYNRTGTQENLLLTGETSPSLTGSSVEYDIHGVLLNEQMINPGDRLIFKLVAEVSGGGANPTVTLTMQGTTDSHFTIQTTTGSFGKIYLRQDATTPLTANWDAVKNITADTFKGLFNWIINLGDSSSAYFTFNGSTLNFSETKLNSTIEDIRSKNFQSSFNENISIITIGNFSFVDFQGAFDSNFSDESIGDFFFTDYQGSFNLNISDVTIGNFSFTDFQSAFNLNISDVAIGNFSFQDYQSSFDLNITELELISSTIGNATYLKLTDFQAAFNVNLTSSGINTTANIEALGFTQGAHTIDTNDSLSVFANNQTVTIEALGFTQGSHTVLSNIFDQPLNKSSNVKFGNITIEGNASFGGNVGIGTASPDQKLDVQGGTQIEGATGGDLLLITSETVTLTDDILGRIRFRSRDTSGGVSTDAAYITVVAEKDFGGAGAETGITFSTIKGATGSPSEKMRIDHEGNVGIGTASPVNELEVSKSTAGSEVSQLIINRITSDTSATSVLKLGHRNNNLNATEIESYRITNWDGNILNHNAGLKFNVVSIGIKLTAMTIHPAGNVGIGTTSPDTFLHVGIRSDTNAWVSGTVEGVMIAPDVLLARTFILGNSIAELTLKDNSFAGVNAKTMALRTNDGITFFGSLKDDFSDFQLTNILVMEHLTGNVGIGTATPADALTVVGDINVSGCIQEDDGTLIGGSCVSSEEYKENFRPISFDREKLKNLNIYEWDWKQDSIVIPRTQEILNEEVRTENTEQVINQVEFFNETSNKTEYYDEYIDETTITITHRNYTRYYNDTINLDYKPIGFKAEELQIFDPSLVTEEDGILKVSYSIGNWLPWIVNSFKDLYNLIDGQDVKIEEQDDRIAMLESELCKKDNSYGFC